MRAVQKLNTNITKYGYLPCSITLKVREPGSAFTHLAAFAASLAGAGPLLMKAEESGSDRTLIAMLVFVLSLLVLYGSSTVFHWIVAGEKITNVFRRLDHISISILIAGSYTAVCLTALRGPSGTRLLVSIWILAVLSILFKLFWTSCPKWISSVLYTGMGWLAVTAFPELFNALATPAFIILLVGGIFYTIGGIIYAMTPKSFNDRHKYFGTHEIFHVFVMIGSLCHYILMLRYLAAVG